MQILQAKETEISTKQQLHQNDHLINCRYYKQGTCKFSENCDTTIQEPTHKLTTTEAEAKHGNKSTTPYRDHNPTVV